MRDYSLDLYDGDVLVARGNISDLPTTAIQKHLDNFRRGWIRNWTGGTPAISEVIERLEIELIARELK